MTAGRRVRQALHADPENPVSTNFVVQYSREMGKAGARNVTVVLDDDVARWARLAAAEQDTSVSRLLGQLLKERMLADRSYQAAMREALREKPLSSPWRGRLPTRDEIHVRR